MKPLPETSLLSKESYEKMLSVQQLSKTFGKFKALDGLDVSIEKGQAVSLIGPNGSGKTTFIKCLLGLVIPDSGSIMLDQSPVIGRWDYRRHIGYMPQIGRYPDHLKVGQLFDMMKDIRRGTYTYIDDELEQAYKIRQIEGKTMRTLSGGTRQKVSACLAFMFNPDMLILDEPTAGLDPLAAEVLKDKILAEKNKGKLILITSHIISDLDAVATDVIYLMDGKIRFYEPVEQLKINTREKTLNRAIAQIMKQHL